MTKTTPHDQHSGGPPTSEAAASYQRAYALGEARRILREAGAHLAEMGVDDPRIASLGLPRGFPIDAFASIAAWILESATECATSHAEHGAIADVYGGIERWASGDPDALFELDPAHGGTALTLFAQRIGDEIGMPDLALLLSAALDGVGLSTPTTRRTLDQHSAPAARRMSPGPSFVCGPLRVPLPVLTSRAPRRRRVP